MEPASIKRKQVPFRGAECNRDIQPGRPARAFSKQTESSADSENAANQNLEQQSRCNRIGIRSEEHTSELQSLMRISYAVFCLKKKKKQKKNDLKKHIRTTTKYQHINRSTNLRQ